MTRDSEASTKRSFHASVLTADTPVATGHAREIDNRMKLMLKQTLPKRHAYGLNSKSPYIN